MLFADTQLAARIEKAECELLRDCAAAIAERRSVRVLVAPVAGGVAVHTRQESPLNKVAGIGFSGPPAAAELDSIEREFKASGTPVQVEISGLAEAGTAALFTARGYQLVGFENVLGRRLPASD